MGAALQRVKADIKDFDPGGVPSLVGGGPWVAMGKHLCGAATDFTLRCIVRCAAAKPHGEALITDCFRGYQFCCDICVGIPLGLAACTACRPPSLVAFKFTCTQQCRLSVRQSKWFASANSECKPGLWHAWGHGFGRAVAAWRHRSSRADMSAEWRLQR